MFGLDKFMDAAVIGVLYSRISATILQMGDRVALLSRE